MTTKITVEATIDALINDVWDYYTNPIHITNWNFADASWHCPSAENNMIIGGLYKARMEAKDGSLGFDFEATYTEISPQQHFTYVSPDERAVTVTFMAKDNQTTLNIVFDAESENPIEMQQNGWQAILNNFKKYAESVR